jgi:fructuronate reductase
MTAATETQARLSARTLGLARTAALPTYDRTAPASIAHLGLGAFVRAHLAVYADELSRRGRSALIRATSLHSSAVADQLSPQDCFYAVAEREGGAEYPPRIIGSITSASTGPVAALEALGAPSTRLVTLTITEKGYDLTEEDLAHPERSSSALGVVARALARCRDLGREPPAVASLDNVMGNGELLRARVTEIAGHLSPSLPGWIAEEVRFPSSVVDRMVPATNAQDVERIRQQLGLVDLGAVTTERHRSWVMTEEEPLLPFSEVGVDIVDDIIPFERRKLWLLNGPHSALAYCGILAGCGTIAEASRHPIVSPFVRRLVDDVLEVAELPTALRPKAFAAEALARFENPILGHTCAKVGADGSRKLPQRFGLIVAARLRAGLDTTRFATVAALWVALAAGLPIGGSECAAVEDPASTRLRSAAAVRDLGGLVHLALDDGFDDPFVASVGDTLTRLLREGIGLLEVRT